jgi:hypothetical protein
MLLDAEFIDLNPLPEELASEIKENSGITTPRGIAMFKAIALAHQRIAKSHRREHPFPVYSVKPDLECDQIVILDSVLLRPKLWNDMAVTGLTLTILRCWEKVVCGPTGIARQVRAPFRT